MKNTPVIFPKNKLTMKEAAFSGPCCKRLQVSGRIAELLV